MDYGGAISCVLYDEQPLKMPPNVNLVSSGNLRGPVPAGSQPASAERSARVTLAEIRPCRKEDLCADRGDPQIAVRRTERAPRATWPGDCIAELYGAFLGRSIFLVYQSNGEVNGFVLGGPSRAMVSCRLAFSRKWALACLAEVARRPKLWLRATPISGHADRELVLIDGWGVAAR